MGAVDLLRRSSALTKAPGVLAVISNKHYHNIIANLKLPSAIDLLRKSSAFGNALC